VNYFERHDKEVSKAKLFVFTINRINNEIIIFVNQFLLNTKAGYIYTYNYIAYCELVP